tara:strand:- start:228 stop:419 length:192 start_codon:yes stop_codon:yes gene_type:complete
MTFEEWLELNEENMSIYFAETGMDRELDFDVEDELERCYEEYLETNENNLDKLPPEGGQGGHY